MDNQALRTTANGACCAECQSNKSTVQKYEKLIRLNRAKLNRPSAEDSQISRSMKSQSHNINRISNKIECDCGLDAQISTAKMWKTNFSDWATKMSLLVIGSNMTRVAKARAFNRIRESPKQAQTTLQTKGADTSGSASTDSQKDHYISVIERVMEIQQRVFQISNEYEASYEGSKANQRNSITLQLALSRSRVENNALHEGLQAMQRRQAKEDHKKKQTLQMLAEEIGQKNQQIAHLRELIKQYERNSPGKKTVLQEDIGTLQINVERLERINDRLNDNLSRAKEAIHEANRRQAEAVLANKQLEFKIEGYEKQKYQMKIKQSELSNQRKQFAHLRALLDRKLKRLGFEEKHSADQSGSICGHAETTKWELKYEAITMFIASISDPSYVLKMQDLFDEQEKNLLYIHKSLWIRHQQKEAENQEPRTKQSHFDISQIEAKGRCNDSVCQIFGGPRINVQEQKGAGLQNIGLRQVDKIVELKQKLLHVRVLVIKLLKSLQLSYALGIEAEGILRVLFDLFEYSELEREGVLSPRRRLFGLL